MSSNFDPCIYFCTFLLECCFRHVDEMAVRGACARHAASLGDHLPQLFSISSSHFQLGGSFNVWSFCLWSVISLWKWAIRNRNTLTALPQGVEVFSLKSDIKNLGIPNSHVSYLQGTFQSPGDVTLGGTTMCKGCLQLCVWASVGVKSRASQNIQGCTTALFRHICRTPWSFRPLVATCAHKQMHDEEAQESFVWTNLSSL